MIQVIKRVFRVGENGIVRVETTLSNTRTGREVLLVTERPDLDPQEWAYSVERAPMARPHEI